MKIRCAGIVLFNPDLIRLSENYESISDQVETVILVDNNSSNITEIKDFFSKEKKVIFIENNNNLGVATALNQISRKSLELGFDWVYLLDQDSISSTTIIKSYEKYVEDVNVALLTPYIIDTNKMTYDEYKSLNLPEVSEVNWAITSGSLINLDVWDKVGMFADELFIDAVDIDYSIRLQINGYKQLRINAEFILQEVGNAEPTFLFRPHKDNSGKWSWKRYYRTNHSLTRQYYMVRNNIILTKKYKNYRSSIRGWLFICIYTFPKLIFERNKVNLIKAIFDGIKAGMKTDVNRYKI